MIRFRYFLAAAVVAAGPAAACLHAQRVAPALGRQAVVNVAPAFRQMEQYNKHIQQANNFGSAAAGNRTRSFAWAVLTAGVAAAGSHFYNQAPESGADGSGGESRTYILAGTLGVGVFTLLSAWDNLGEAGRYERLEQREVAAARRIFPDRPLR